MFGPYTFINVFGGREELDDVGHSRKNMVEVALVLKLLRSLCKGILCKILKFLLPSCLGLFIYDYSRRLGIFSVQTDAYNCFALAYEEIK